VVTDRSSDDWLDRAKLIEASKPLAQESRLVAGASGR
jgi:hypothetical protein